MVLLERIGLLAQGHNHDDPTSRFLNATHTWGTLYCTVFKDLTPKLWKTQLRTVSSSTSDRQHALGCGRNPWAQVRARELHHFNLYHSVNQSSTQNKQQPGAVTWWNAWAKTQLSFRITLTIHRLLSQPRMLCASSSVNNWKTEHLHYIVEIILELHSCKHCL